MKTSRNSAGTAYLVMALPFLVLGMSQIAFLPLGIAFLAIGLSLNARSKCALK